MTTIGKPLDMPVGCGFSTLQDERDGREPLRYLIHDPDAKFTWAFDAVFEAEGMEIVLTPRHTPQANAVAERWIRSVREECLDHLLILNQRHLGNVLTEYTAYYNAARPHQGLAQQTPLPLIVSREGRVCCRDVLGGIIHDYYRQVA